MSEQWPLTPKKFLDQGTHLLNPTHFHETDNQCAICHDDQQARTVRINYCTHVFHEACLIRRISTRLDDGLRPTCPLCRSVLDIDQIMTQHHNAVTALFRRVQPAHSPHGGDVHTALQGEVAANPPAPLET
jgi:hypothetical protein